MEFLLLVLLVALVSMVIVVAFLSVLLRTQRKVQPNRAKSYARKPSSTTTQPAEPVIVAFVPSAKLMDGEDTRVLTMPATAPNVIAADTPLHLHNIANGATCTITNPRTILTRDMIDLNDTQISRANGMFYFQHGHWWISELPNMPSRNGLFINGTRVIDPVIIKPSDHIRVGQTLLVAE